MNMVQYADYTFADSDHLRQPDPADDKSTEAANDDDYEKQLLEKLQAGEISQGQYDTLTRTNAKDVPYSENVQFVEMVDAAEPSTPQEQTPQYQISATYWTDQLTEDDINYLMLK